MEHGVDSELLVPAMLHNHGLLSGVNRRGLPAQRRLDASDHALGIGDPAPQQHRPGRQCHRSRRQRWQRRRRGCATATIAGPATMTPAITILLLLIGFEGGASSWGFVGYPVPR